MLNLGCSSNVDDAETTSTWENYLSYLRKWSVDHAGEEFCGCSPAGYDEYINNEYAEE